MKHLVLAAVGLLIAAVCIPQPAVVHAAGRPIALVIAANSTIKDLDFALVRRAYSGLPTEVDGKRIIPINHANGSPLRVAFDRVVLGLEPGDVGKFWIDKRIRDEGSPPKTVPSPELAIRIAASLPSAITYATLESVNPTVKVLTIGGKAPNQAGYPLVEK